MKIFALHRFLFCAFVASALSLSALAQSQVGRILVAKVDGEVLKLLPDNSSVALKSGDTVTEADTITTGKESSTVLVFMNGSSVKLGAESRLAVEQFKMDPLAEDIDVSELKAEPSVSQTKLKLYHGEMVGDVKKLNKDSKYTIDTPVGAAGIRGTIYRIVFRPAANGKAFFTVQTAEGQVVMEGVTVAEIPVDAGKEVVVEIDVPETEGETAAPPLIVTKDIPPETQSLITREAAVITQTVQETVFIPTPTTPDPTPPPATPEPEKEAEPDPTPTTPAASTPDPAPLLPTPPPPSLTSGAGK